MKRKLTALVLAMCMTISSANFIFADDSSTVSTEEEATTETTTETTTEATTEEETTTEATTTTTTVAATTEATTTSTTTTTKASSTNSKVSESYDISVSEGSSKSVSSYLTASLNATDFTWKTSDSATATVSSSGSIKGVDSGTCTVTATVSDGGVDYTYTFNVTVKSSSSSSSTTKSFSIDVGDTKDLYDYVDDDYEARDYDWSSNKTSVATVSAKGVVTGKSDGTATITVTCEEDDDLEYKFKITVGDDDDDDDEVAIKTDWDIYLGTGDKFDVSDILEDDPDEYDWDVDDEDIAEVDEDDGVIKGLDEGETDIEANGDDDYTFTVHVDDDYSIDEMTIKGATTKDLEDYLDEDIDEYDFSSDRKAVATVSSKGVVTAVANGIASILCEHEDGDIIQIFVTVSGISTTTTTTTTETTTETTTAYVATTTTEAISFTDISHRAWAIDSIKAMVSKGYIVGVGNNKFSPDANCKRCDFTIVLMKILDLSGEPNDEYDDISSKDYFYDYVMSALNYGIESGVTNKNFRPNDYITREEMMVMVYKGLVAKGISMNSDTSVLSGFSDASEVSAENQTAVAALVNSGAISGTSDTTLEAKANITRAQMAVIMNKVDQMM